MDQAIFNCPVEAAVSIISNKWRIFIFRELLTGKKRFNQLQKALPNITQKVLTQNLRDLVQNGLITRTVFAEVPPRVEYELTALGYSLSNVIDSLKEWGQYYMEYIKQKEPKK